jgi:hypothetical protein
MARREWAQKRVDQLMRLDVPFADETDVVWLLKLEHARAVRVVRQAKALRLHGLRDTDTNEFLEGYEAACNDILAAIQKGRA